MGALYHLYVLFSLLSGAQTERERLLVVPKGRASPIRRFIPEAAAAAVGWYGAFAVVQLHLDSSGRERFCRILFKKEFFWGAEKREYSRVLLPYSERKNKVSRRLLACTGSVLVRRTGLSGCTHAHGVCGSGFDRYTSILHRHSCMYVRHSVLFY